MSDGETLLPAAYAPYRSPRDYILNWTDVIWIDRAIGRLADHYGQDVRVHTAYGETYDFDTVINNSVQKFAAFPNTGGGLGEDVVWEQRGANGFISSHRSLKSGTHSGYWIYGAADRPRFRLAHHRPLPGAGQQDRRGMAGARRMGGARGARPRPAPHRRAARARKPGHRRGAFARGRDRPLRRPLPRSRAHRHLGRATGAPRRGMRADHRHVRGRCGTGGASTA